MTYKERAKEQAYKKSYYIHNRQKILLCTKVYQKDNPKKVKKWKKVWSERHRKEERVRAVLWRKNNREKSHAIQKAYRDRNLEKIAAHKKIFAKNNPEKFTFASKLYRQRHPERVHAQHKKYRECHREERNTYSKDYGRRNRNKINQYQNNKRKTNIQFRLANRLRIRLLDAVKSNYKGGSAVSNLGCSVSDLKVYLESQFKIGMYWENWGHNTWNIDHKIPLSHFNLSNPKEVKKACHYTNLQPMWAKENFSKGNRINL